ncbi:amylo-alpha-1,6-glucosidase [Ramlibacter alkalitolerans]|uniref:Glycogen debranching enzyme family protein n=1 Tax=Ramlibacter alkalitolerans TaxID=2039631 RepID=A0ABS1JRX9_9BURK|nr:amylo-alpha-1,6-glucosidase [Ramlibacter alkalitolerans]MBL0426616.1 glycogen debranching enzyme family protein [Ramlibacter alkalitolerans]
MAEAILNKMPWGGNSEPPERLLTREWLVTNGLGGYASGSVAGVATRRYHGLLIAALPTPIGRTVMLSHLGEWVRLPDRRTIRVAGEERPERPYELPDILTEFRLEMGLPVWTYHVGDAVIEKRILLPYGQNTVHLNYRMVAGGHGVRLILRPRLHFRGHENPVEDSYDEPCRLHVLSNRFEVHSESNPQLPPLRMTLLGRDAQLVLEGGNFEEFFYRLEAARGYAARGRVWTPGRFRAELAPGEECTLIASTESWDTIHALNPQQALRAEHARREKLIEQADPAARTGRAAELVLAADQFIIAPFSRQADAARAQAEGDQARTVIAGYHWFTDWGRDTMISLEGLTLTTGRHAEAGYILRTFLHYVKDGLIPNMFPEGQNEGLYHTADATLWFFHAMDRYVQVTGDRLTLRHAIPTFCSIIEHHLRGTRFNIGVDHRDGLLKQGAEGYQLTWMDAKVEGWVVTPRRGKAVELNALFYNALRLMERWLREEGDEAHAQTMAQHAQRTYDSFNQRFWNPQTGCLYDVIDGEGGDDPAIRPNQVFSIALPHPVLDPQRWRSVLDVAQRLLVTPVGLRSLAPGHPDYKPNYDGDLRARDAAYHQGTVWGWLAGPFADAWLKVYPDDNRGIEHLIDGFAAHLGEACIGSISEIFDAEPPFTPRGCVAQAWSVAEVLRILVKCRHALAAQQQQQQPGAAAEKKEGASSWSGAAVHA